MKLPLEPCVTLMGWSHGRVYEPSPRVVMVPEPEGYWTACVACGAQVEQRPKSGPIKAYCSCTCRNRASQARRMVRRRAERAGVQP